MTWNRITQKDPADMASGDRISAFVKRFEAANIQPLAVQQIHRSPPSALPDACGDAPVAPLHLNESDALDSDDGEFIKVITHASSAGFLVKTASHVTQLRMGSTH